MLHSAVIYIYLGQKLASVPNSQLSVPSISTKFDYLLSPPPSTGQSPPPPLHQPEEEDGSLQAWAELIRETKDNMKMSEGGYKGHTVTLFTSRKV